MAYQTFNVSYVAKLFEISNDTVKNWAELFADYLSKTANPSKGIERKFKIEDIRVLSYVCIYWEKNPDIDNINIGLNRHEHNNNELIEDLILQLRNFVFDPNDDMDETWNHGILLGGMAEIGDIYYLANSYKLAGDKLIDIALKNEELFDVFCPSIYNYRHATELYLKDATNYKRESDKKGNGHQLLPLFKKFEGILKNKYSQTCPKWFSSIIETFNYFDSDGTTFRYGKALQSDEIFIDFNHMKKLMEKMSAVFKNFKDNHF